MALCFILLALFDADLKNGVINIVKKIIEIKGREFVWAAMVTVLFISGFILSIYHAFSSRPKSDVEKITMLVFALGINGVTGVIAGIRIINDSHGLLIVFPVLNILSSVVLLYLIGFADPTILDDEDVSSCELILGAIIATTVFYFCQFRFELHWSATFSICVAYAMIANDIVGRLFIRRLMLKQHSVN